ncbi:MAG TPA: serine/threonine-protein kinase [Candidatus Dormibacteraeota bacterium]|nr:serine/threonine-protein kinase [Candidatus Dormibacteraeota bacterium]
MTVEQPTGLPRLSDYEITAVLAGGSTGTFFVGKHRVTGHSVVLQRLADQLTGAEGFVDRLGGSARRVAALRNPHVVGVYDLVVEEGVYLVLELVPGASLRAMAAEGQVLPPAAAIAAVDDVLNALEAAHAEGIVHGDIRAEHVLVTAMGTAKLGGFAVSGALQGLPAQAGAGRPGYASPERLAGHPPDAGSDLYAVAALASELMTGSTPSPGRIGPPALPAVAEVLRRGLSAEASRRFASATELRMALIAATAGSMGPSWRLASDLGARAAAVLHGPDGVAAVLPSQAATAAAGGPGAVGVPGVPGAAAAGPVAGIHGFSVPPPPGAAVLAGAAPPPPMARPVSTPPASYLPPPQPRARAAITEVDSEENRRRRWVVPLILVLVLLLVAGGTAGGLYAAGVIGGTSTAANSGPLTVSPNVTLTAAPAQGGCDTTFAFEAKGALTGTGTLVYRWERSDGMQTADTSLPITSDFGSFKFNTTWRILGKQQLNARMTFRVVSPTARSVSQAISYTCA